MMVGRHADCCPIEATTCTHMHTCTSAMLARSGRRGGGLFDRTVFEQSRNTVKRLALGAHGGLPPRLRGSCVLEGGLVLLALEGTRSRSWA